MKIISRFIIHIIVVVVVVAVVVSYPLLPGTLGCGLDSSASEHAPVAGYCQHSSESLNIIKEWNFLISLIIGFSKEILLRVFIKLCRQEVPVV
jgi:hypothetical protein